MNLRPSHTVLPVHPRVRQCLERVQMSDALSVLLRLPLGEGSTPSARSCRASPRFSRARFNETGYTPSARTFSACRDYDPSGAKSILHSRPLAVVRMHEEIQASFISPLVLLLAGLRRFDGTLFSGIGVSSRSDGLDRPDTPSKYPQAWVQDARDRKPRQFQAFLH